MTEVELLKREIEELKAFVRTMATFGGNVQQARDLAKKNLERLEKSGL